jgi:hypothetical protein
MTLAASITFQKVREDIDGFMHAVAEGQTAARTKTGKKHGLANVRGGKGTVAGTVVPALVEREEPRGLAFQVRAEAHLGVVHSEVHHTAPELEQQFPRVAVATAAYKFSRISCTLGENPSR